MNTNRITPDNITELKENEIFVFGSNEAGIHGAGAAHTARQWGARYWLGEGLSEQTYALPTKDRTVTYTLTLTKIQQYVDNFIETAKGYPHLTFLVTEIGCGLAGLTPEQVAPLFENAKDIENIHLPQRFWDVLNN